MHDQKKLTKIVSTTELDNKTHARKGKRLVACNATKYILYIAKNSNFTFYCQNQLFVPFSRLWLIIDRFVTIGNKNLTEIGLNMQLRRFFFIHFCKPLCSKYKLAWIA